MHHIARKFQKSEIITLLSHPPFLNFTLSVLFSQIGFNMMNVTLIFLIFNLTHSNFSVSMLILSFLIPQIILSFLGGIIADLRDKKTILIWGNFLRAAVLLLLFFNPHSVFLVYLVAFTISVVTQFYIPAEAPMIPYLVNDRKHLVVANSIFGLGLFGSILISYVLAGPAVALVGRSQAFLILSVLFCLAGFFASLIPKKASKLSGVEGAGGVRNVKRAFRSELHASYTLLRKTEDIGGAFFLLAFSQVVILILAAVVPGYAEKILNIPAENLSLLLFAPAAIGMIVASFFTNGLCKKISRTKVMNIGIVLSGISLFLFPFTTKVIAGDFVTTLNSIMPAKLALTNAFFAAFLAFMAGLANAFIFIPSQTIIQDVTPQDFQSKIYGLLYALVGVFSLIPILIAGSLADIVGVGSVLGGVGVFILGIAFLRIYRRSKKR